MNARDIMTTDVVTIESDATVKDAAKLMLETRTSALPVVRGGELVGIISHSDYGPHESVYPAGRTYSLMGELFGAENMEVVCANLRDRRVSDVMHPDVSTATEDTQVWDIAERMARERIRHMPIVKDKRLVGIVTQHDFLKVMAC